MSKVKKAGSFLVSLLLTLLTFVFGASSGVMMADAANLPDAGVTESGNPGEGGAGISTETGGRANGDPDFYLNDVDKRITKIRPMSTPVDQISRYAKSSDAKSHVVKYYSVGTRPIKATTSSAVTAMVSGSSCVLPVDDDSIFTLDDTIRVVGVKGLYDERGVAYPENDPNVPDLVLCVCGRDTVSTSPVVYAVNGNKDASGKPILVPAIPKGTTVVRMGKACGELDVQTGRFNNIPMPEENYCQNFMLQVEQSTFDKISAKEVNWTFSDLEEDGVYDMRLAQENTFLWGVKNVIAHPSKDGMNTYFTKGIWWMAGKDIEVGHWDSTASAAVISDEDLVDITKDLFVGTGTGNKRKILLCGSDMLSAFSKIKSDKFRLKETVEVWNLKFKSWDTDFGEVLTIHHELFDINGMSDCGFAMDPEYLNKKTFVSWTRSVLDLKKAGVRNTDAAVIQEVSCLYLRYPKAHARMRLAQASETPEPVAVTGIELNHTTAAISTDGGTYELEATLSPEDAEGEVEWTSSDETIATVSDEGVVTAVGNGTVVIIAACNNKVATCTVTVSNQT